MASTFSPDWDEIRRVYNNCVNAGVPVLDWDTFTGAVDDLMDAHVDYLAVRDEIWEAQESAVPSTHTDRYPGFLDDQGPHVQALFGLDSDTYCSGGVGDLHRADFKFKLSEGKSPRNPLGCMKKRAASFRRYAKKLEEGLRAYEAAVVAAGHHES